MPYHVLSNKRLTCILIEAAKTAWRSDAYDHYEVTLQQDFHVNGDPLSISFIFTWHFWLEKHKSLVHPRSKTSEGTSNLVKTMNACLRAQGLTPKKCLVETTIIPYSPTNHQALLALCCARSNRPFNIVTDLDYQDEIMMLCPNTIIPNPSMVNRDLKMIYLEMSKHVQRYFEVCSMISIWIKPLYWSKFRNMHNLYTWFSMVGHYHLSPHILVWLSSGMTIEWSTGQFLSLYSIFMLTWCLLLFFTEIYQAHSTSWWPILG